jgi:Protein of unknown function (DUF642)
MPLAKAPRTGLREQRVCSATVVGVASAAVATVSGGTRLSDPSVQFVNGSFEKPAVSPGGDDFLDVGATIPGWTVVGPSGGNISLLGPEFTYAGYSFPAEKGKQLVDLTGSSNTSTGVAQKLPTSAGKSYKVTFYVGNVYGPDQGLGKSSKIDVLIDGKKVLAARNSKGKGTKKLVWEKFSATFRASSSSTTVSFIYADPSNDTANCLDNVTLSAG